MSNLEQSSVELVKPHPFDPEKHYYTRVLNATIHPVMQTFLSLSHERMMNRYCHLHPRVDRDALWEALTYRPRFLRWAGADLFHVTTLQGVRQMVVVEVNSSPSGQKSMPLYVEHDEQGGYGFLIDKVFDAALSSHRMKEGALAVIYDKNYMEASGYATALANRYQQPVYLAPYFLSDPNPPVRFTDGVLEVQQGPDEWVPVRAAMRYVTQKPWTRIPLSTKTMIVNPVLACLAGGRNKMLAAMAYDLHNADLKSTGLSIRVPETIRDVRKAEIPLLIKRFGGFAVVKVPYSNAGQGVYTITNDAELAFFMDQEFEYERFIVQSLIGNFRWSSEGTWGKYYHVGTIPNKSNEIYVADVRMMIGATDIGYCPVAVYCRRARKPLVGELAVGEESWDMLGTNLSVKTGTDAWESETKRLMLMDRRDFNKLGLGLDTLIDSFIQTVLAVTAIDKMACNLVNQKGKFRTKLFRSLNDDPGLLDEIVK